MQGIRQSEREGEKVGGGRRSDEHWMSIQAIYLHGGLGITYTPRLHLHTVERLLAAEQGAGGLGGINDIVCAMTMIEINGFMAVGARILAEINQKMLKVTCYDCEIDAAI